ncbi:MAG TPA: molecular chaperone DnaJ [Alteromonas australica]|jgi:DNA-J related protein|uniref:Molecular chaperone DnaJ n=1 Tax=Alteromonas australica TaxID=589873 RepID=A0A353JP65_9ALTE|nr:MULTISPECIES: DNA-J related domain-containing protein [Alteromonas]MAB93141.1 molecular chaperone DnaJ [Alteromonas sp.]MAF70103.1 molecular chaperone DnaJ [Alteromonas sp.]MBU32965.1 molecular chaperone DnaJ [Alteromonas sp.]QPL50255.1 molecular chaperone DnaJ [Alteromonas sp. B31-7]HAW77026.1 molecular chaperone DnaJ [Alteromonas australica]|tara:strand:+ start:13937 stop:14590 length:654 start_codon:yes stop_codon:yes gene_type:complete
MNTSLVTLLEDSLLLLKPTLTLGISEFDLIALLKRPPYSLFDEDALRDPLMLFQTHFLVFHALYKLQIKWRESGEGRLDIHTTKILLRDDIQPQNIPLQNKDATQAQTHLAGLDPLASYYLNLDNLKGTSEADVAALLDDFWRQMAGQKLGVPNTKDRDKACDVLKLDKQDILTLNSLKAHYRKALLKVHPDRGGNVEEAQQVIQAYRVLLSSLKRV